MIDKLIEEGQKLRKTSTEGLAGSRMVYKGQQFEEWSSKVALFFEGKLPSAVKDKVLQQYSTLKADNSVRFYQTAMGALEAYKEMDMD